MSPALKERLRADLNAARKARDKLRTTVLGTLLSEVKNREIELGREVLDPELEGVVVSAIKRRREAAEQIRAGGREELAQKEEQEAVLLQMYLPPPIEEADVRSMVREAIAAGAKDLGSVMRTVMPQVKGRFDGKDLNRIVKEEIG